MFDDSREIEIINCGDEDAYAASQYSYYRRVRVNKPYVADAYNTVKNDIMQYRVGNGISNTICNTCEKFYVGGVLKILFEIEANKLVVYFALDPKEFHTADTMHYDVSSKKEYKQVPMKMKISDAEALRKAEMLIARIIQESGCSVNPSYKYVDYAAWFILRELNVEEPAPAPIVVVHTPPPAPAKPMTRKSIIKKVRKRAIVVDEFGNKIGTVRNDRLYNLDGEEWMHLYREEEVEPYGIRYYVVADKNDGGYIDDNLNLIRDDGLYVATLKYKKPIWLLILIAVLLALLVALTTLVVFDIIAEKRREAQEIDIVMTEESGNAWGQKDYLSIFPEDVRTGEKLLAPGYEGSYDFVVNNENDLDLIVHLTFGDKNTAEVPMRYKLRMGNVYVIGDDDNYVTVDKLALEDVKVEPESATRFTLEWIWVEEDDEKDTAIGNLDFATYTLTVDMVIEKNLDN